MLSEAICWILSNNYSIPYLIHLLDDFLIISPPESIPAAHLLTVQKVFSELGIPIAQEKTMGPATSIEFLGIKLDTINFQASLPKEKIDRIILVASTLLENPNCSKRELLSLLDHLNFAMRIIPQGRPFISHLLFLASSVHELEDQISLTTSCSNELSLWITFLKQWNGLSFFYNNLISLPTDIQLFTDAAPSVGFGGFYQGRWFASTWPAQFNQPFPSFSLLNITSFISYLDSTKNLKARSIKGYLSGIQFFHKLLFGSPSADIANSQTSMLIKGIQKTQPTRPDARQPITLDILTKCISTLRRGYHSTNTARTLDAMFILAFFGFLRCSELTITSNFNPKVHPTISDLSVLDNKTISYFIKQSKTDQMKKGHFIYIFNLQSPIQPYQTLFAYSQFRNSQTKSPSDPLFTDEFNRPVTRFWFQKHLKSILLQANIPANNFSSHSFRIGAATTAAQKALSQQQIQELGRWSSEAFKSYIRSNHLHTKEAQRSLLS
ncbi:uncharacterized protein LOC130082429 [Rhinichthys klamathensis goyatoka]|uniref:uncharacterized protein LOC130082429 n=1 Tax=Rhinichthys klamathensis goyatoka TaxID=3034132 RepID=UPI0024B4F46F|nr:uncharacterized protein LOC130082429 [Rhinichthys klamathensis goyatoka]